MDSVGLRTRYYCGSSRIKQLLITQLFALERVVLLRHCSFHFLVYINHFFAHEKSRLKLHKTCTHVHFKSRFYSVQNIFVTNTQNQFGCMNLDPNIERRIVWYTFLDYICKLLRS